MSAELLSYYNRELSFIRRLAAQFADEHPKIAGRLRLGPESSEDPHVERMIEAFAYLTARIRHKLDDEFPELTEALLGILYPHYQAPIPSMAIVQLELDPEQPPPPTGYVVARHTELETEPVQGEPCKFRTCYPVTLFPIEVTTAELSKPPFVAPSTPVSARAAACLRLVLSSTSSEMEFAAMEIPSLRFFLKGQPQHVYRLYEFILNNTLEVVAAKASNDPAPVRLGPACLSGVGFERDEGLLPYPARSFLGYRLLSELFAFSPKFLFFDVGKLTKDVLGRLGNKLELYFYLSQSSADLEQNISADTFRLGCTPIVNLYKQHAEPIQLTHTDYEYRVVPDARRPLAHEIYAVEDVTATTLDSKQVEILPFYSVRHAQRNRIVDSYWQAMRRPAEQAGGGAIADHGTEVYLALIDLQFQPSVPPNWTLDVQTTCLNRDLPSRLPFGGDQPRLQITEGGGLVSRISCLTPPTRTLRPALKRGTLWRLISHLALNHLSLVGEGTVEGAEGEDTRAEALKEILTLYDFTDSAETRNMIEGILRVGSRRIVGRTGSLERAFCRGVEISIQFDEERFTGSGVFLFASVLERFLALYCTVNSFSKLIATTKDREGELRRWPPRMGERVLV